ncbi:MAG: RNA pseudouridine synthase [Epsilonproteobacteria bacterium]|nr:MAG: RNA pseudouridine synthase [Campylobacterota bacterium]
MPFKLKRHKAVLQKPIQQYLIEDVGLPISMAQKYIAKNRIYDEFGNNIKNKQKLKTSFVDIAVFEPTTKGLKPIFQNRYFAIFDKPSGLMVHPTSRNTQYCLLDEVRYYLGEKANLAHRIDAGTSGLVLSSIDKHTDTTIKTMFEDRQITKEYIAVVSGKITKNTVINEPIQKATNSLIGVKMETNPQGKQSKTIIKPIFYDYKTDTSKIKIIPITGRQHQIRVHLNSINRTILGDTIYGIDETIADKILTKSISKQTIIKHTKSPRLMLQANRLKFVFDRKTYDIYSKQNLKL